MLNPSVSPGNQPAAPTGPLPQVVQTVPPAETSIWQAPISGRFTGSNQLVLSPLAYLKWQYLCNAVNVEVGGFGISRSMQELLYVEDIRVIKQVSSAYSTEFDDAALATYMEEMAMAGHDLQRCCRLWFHTHPEIDATPSMTDESTFSTKFNDVDWAVMGILSKTNQLYARLKLNVNNLTISKKLEVAVDWRSVGDLVHSGDIGILMQNWQSDLAQLVKRPVMHFTPMGPSPLQNGFLRTALDPEGLEGWYRYDPDDYLPAGSHDPDRYQEILEHVTQKQQDQKGRPLSRKERKKAKKLATRLANLDSPLGHTPYRELDHDINLALTLEDHIVEYGWGFSRTENRYYDMMNDFLEAQDQENWGAILDDFTRQYRVALPRELVMDRYWPNEIKLKLWRHLLENQQQAELGGVYDLQDLEYLKGRLHATSPMAPIEQRIDNAIDNAMRSFG